MTGPGSFRRIAVGAVEIFALADGLLDLPLALFPTAAEPGADASFGPGPFPIAINCYAIRTAGRLYLVDAGCGPWRGETNGKLVEAMKAAGLDPDAVDAVLMTHLHGDHAGGLFTEAGAVFPRATLMLAEAERAHWTDPTLPARIPERMKGTLATAARALAAYEGRTATFAPGAEVAPGVTAVALPGHTPGQTGFRIESGGEHLFVWADIVHVEAVQFPHPDWPIVFDTDSAEAARTRLRVFAECAAANTRIAGMHLGFPGTGRVVRTGERFAFAPDPA